MAHSGHSRRKDVHFWSEARASKWINNKLQPLNFKESTIKCSIACLVYDSFSVFSTIFFLNEQTNWKLTHAHAHLFFRSILWVFYLMATVNVSATNNNNNNIAYHKLKTLWALMWRRIFQSMLWVCVIRKQQKNMKNDRRDQTFHIFLWMIHKSISVNEAAHSAFDGVIVLCATL